MTEAKLQEKRWKKELRRRAIRTIKARNGRQTLELRKANGRRAQEQESYQPSEAERVVNRNEAPKPAPKPSLAKRMFGAGRKIFQPQKSI